MKCEGCFDAEVDPWRPAGKVSDAEVLRVLRLTRPRMQQSARDGFQARAPAIYGHAGRPCPRCGAPILRRGSGTTTARRTGALDASTEGGLPFGPP